MLKLLFYRMFLNKKNNLLKKYQKAKEWILKNTVNNQGIAVSDKDPAPYPEVSGYFIPTLLKWGFRDLAYSYAKWLVSVQNPDGSWNDPSGKAPYTFDTGQILKGLLAADEVFGEFKEPVKRGCNWLLTQISDDGCVNTPDTSSWGLANGKTIPDKIHLYAIEPLLTAGKWYKAPEYIQKAEKAVNYYLAQDDLAEFTTLSHFHAYIIEALVDLGYTERAKKEMEQIEKFQKNNGAIPAYNDVSWVCSTGLFQYAVILYKLGNTDRANKAFNYAVQLQNKSGGFYGGYGFGSNYFKKAEISWAIKYFLDALYLKIQSDFGVESDLFPDYIDKTDGRYKLVADEASKLAAGKVLDAGCGKGRFLKNLKEDFNNIELYGVDVSEKMLEFAQKHAITRTGSLLQLPFEDGFFDFIYTVEAMEHAVDIENAVKELFRCAKKGGKVLIIDKNRCYSGKLKPGEWEQWFYESDLVKMLESNGFRACTVKNIPYDGQSGKNGLFTGWIGTKIAEKPSEKLVSIVLPTYNKCDVLPKSVESCLSQTYKNIELIIVNDGSTDGTDEVIKKYLQKDCSVKYVKQKNKKLPKALNAGFNAANGEYLTWTSDDNEYLPDAIEEMVKALEEYGEDCLVYSNCYIFGDDCWVLKELITKKNKEELRKRNFIGPCFLYTRKIMETIGQYSPVFFLAEDYDYWIRISRKFPLVHLDKFLYKYYFGEKSLTGRKSYRVKLSTALVKLRHGFLGISDIWKVFKNLGKIRLSK